MTPPHDPSLTSHPVVDHDAWIAARTQLLAKEKEFTRLSDEMSSLRHLARAG